MISCQGCDRSMVRSRHREAWQVRHHGHGFCNACAMRRKRHPKEPDVPTPTLSDFDWHPQAACRPGRGVDPEWFFPERGGSTLKARSTCERCPVRAKCLDFALDHGMNFGIYGGLSADERARRLRHPSARKGRAA